MAGETIAAVLDQQSGPLTIAAGSDDDDMPTYVIAPIRTVPLEHIAHLPAGAVAGLAAHEWLALADLHPEL